MFESTSGHPIPDDMEYGSTCLTTSCHATVWETAPQVCENGHDQPPLD